jgi:ribosomal protein S12 methylthiotransferase accessory factor
VRGYSLTRDRDVLVPASLVYLPYRPAFTDEAVLSPAISTGLACAATIEQATLTALCEVIERDACMIMWLNRLSLPRVEMPEDVRRGFFVSPGNRPLAELQVVDLTTDIGIPAMMALTFSRISGRRIATAGASSHLNPLKAAQKAVTESTNSLTILQIKMKETPEWSFDPEYANIIDFVDHGFLYAQPGMLDQLEFVYDSPNVREIGDLPDQSTGDYGRDVQHCVKQLESAGLESIVVDVTTDDIRDAGFRVVRALVPGTTGLNANYRLRFLGGSRLYEAPVRMGLRRRPLSESELNPQPHPFQ